MQISKNIRNKCGVPDWRAGLKADVAPRLADFGLSVSPEPEMTSLGGQGP